MADFIKQLKDYNKVIHESYPLYLALNYGLPKNKYSLNNFFLNESKKIKTKRLRKYPKNIKLFRKKILK
jgi:hypothetical protein